MSLSSETLSAIQKAGAAVYEADVELKNAVMNYAQRVNGAIAANPYHLGNDALFENWKVVARLAQTLSGIEEELKKMYQVASDLIADEQPLLVQLSVLAAPARAVEQEATAENDMTPTDVVAKSRKAARPVPRASKATPAPMSRRGHSGNQMALGGNAAKLWRHFEKSLDVNKFSVISQTAIGQETGIPLGSMTSAVKKLIACGLIVAGPAGSFRRVNAG